MSDRIDQRLTMLDEWIFPKKFPHLVRKDEPDVVQRSLQQAIDEFEEIRYTDMKLLAKKNYERAFAWLVVRDVPLEYDPVLALLKGVRFDVPNRH